MEIWERELAEIRASMAETMKGFAEIRKLQEENAKEFEKVWKLQEKNAKEFEKLGKFVKEVSKNVDGINSSNGKVAEDYFFNSLCATKTLGGVHFDMVKRHLSNSIPLEDGKTLDGEYDIALINKDSLGIVEVKYTVHKKDVENLVKKQVKNFKTLFPMYSKYKFYLGICGLSFNKQAEDAANKFGVGMLKLNGDAVEIRDKNLKVY
ncbi:MAG: hypothetical protein FWF51_00060 [Chitinivibrionia bacterium]|nr:hypothetical protein [Chitinivibrionia bacterium]